MPKIFFILDLCRYPFTPKSHHIRAAQSIKDIFSWQIEQVTNDCSLNFIASSLEQDNGFDRKKFYKLMNVEYKEENWSIIYDAEPTTGAIEYFQSLLKNACLIIGYEIPPVFLKILNHLQLIYLDIRIASIKYLDDLALGFKTNHKPLFNRLLEYRVCEDQFRLEASLLKAKYLYINHTLDYIKPNSAVFAGQTLNDASLIKKGKLLNLLDYEYEFKQKTQQFETIYYKKHPHTPDHSAEYKFIKQFKNIEMIHTNIYHLMSCNNIQEFFAISSGTTQEAEYFNKRGDVFYQSIFQYIKNGQVEFSKDRYVCIYKVFFEPNFWANILSTVTTTNQLPHIQLIPTPNRMRNLHNVFWGYEESRLDYTAMYNDLYHQLYTRLNNKRLSRKLDLFFQKIKSTLHKKIKNT